MVPVLSAELQRHERGVGGQGQHRPDRRIENASMQEHVSGAGSD
jgi:hypothetical protein